MWRASGTADNSVDPVVIRSRSACLHNMEPAVDMAGKSVARSGGEHNLTSSIVMDLHVDERGPAHPFISALRE